MCRNINIQSKKIKDRMGSHGDGAVVGLVWCTLVSTVSDVMVVVVRLSDRFGLLLCCDTYTYTTLHRPTPTPNFLRQKAEVTP